MNSQVFTLPQAHGEHPAGTKVAALRYHDYGLASDDTRHTGVEHVSVTLDLSGDYPSFTIPKSYLAPAATPD